MSMIKKVNKLFVFGQYKVLMTGEPKMPQKLSNLMSYIAIIS